jgi:hypothetical protein
VDARQRKPAAGNIANFKLYIGMKSYFPHDSSARNDEKIIALRMKYGMEGYGVYFAILERMREERDYKCVKDYNVVAFDLRVDSALIKSVCEDFGLFVFTENGKYFYSESFLRRMEQKDKASQNRSFAAKAKWEKRKTDANAMQMHTESDAIKVNKSKVNNIPSPLPPPDGVGEAEAEKKPSGWRESFNVYLTEIRAAYKAAVRDAAYIAERSKYHPGVDIELSLEKACVEFWATEAGWRHKRKSKSSELNWRSTFTKALDIKSNQVWKSRNSNENGAIPTAKEAKIVG